MLLIWISLINNLKILSMCFDHQFISYHYLNIYYMLFFIKGSLLEALTLLLALCSGGDLVLLVTWYIWYYFSRLLTIIIDLKMLNSHILFAAVFGITGGWTYLHIWLCYWHTGFLGFHYFVVIHTILLALFLDIANLFVVFWKSHTLKKNNHFIESEK